MLVLLRPKTLFGYMNPQSKELRFPRLGQTGGTTAAPDFPERSIPYVRDEPDMPELEQRQDAPSTNTVQSKTTKIEVSHYESPPRTQPIPIPRAASVRFAEEGWHDEGRRARGKTPARTNRYRQEHRDPRQRPRSPFPAREHPARPRAVPIPARNPFQRVVPTIDDDTTGWVDDVDDHGDKAAADDDDDDTDRDVTTVKNPLANYPGIGQSLQDPKRPVQAAGAQISLLTEAFPRYNQICEDVGFASRVQAVVERQHAISQQAKISLQEFSAQGKKTRLPAYQNPGGPDWGFDMTDPGCHGTSIFGKPLAAGYLEKPKPKK